MKRRSALYLQFLFLPYPLMHKTTVAVIKQPWVLNFIPVLFLLKTFNKPNRAFEGLAYIYGDGIRFTGLYEIHGDINGADGLKWYIGPGNHIGFFNDGWKKDHPDENSTIAIGVDGVLGWTVKYPALLMLVRLAAPFNFVGYNSFEAGWGRSWCTIHP